MESGGDPMKRIQLMQDYMGQATPQVLEATGRETTRRQGKEVARAEAGAKTEGMQLIGNEKLAMNRMIVKEANSVAKQTALISAGATLLGQMATVGIPEWKKKQEFAKLIEGTESTGEGYEAPYMKSGYTRFEDIAASRFNAGEPTGVELKAARARPRDGGFGGVRIPEEQKGILGSVTPAQLKQMGEVARGDIKAKPPVFSWPEGMDAKSPEAGVHVLEQFWGNLPLEGPGRMDAFDAWADTLGANKPRDWRQAFDLLVAQQQPRPARLPIQSVNPPPPETARNTLSPTPGGIPGVDSPMSPIDNFGWGRMA